MFQSTPPERRALVLLALGIAIALAVLVLTGTP